AERVPQGDGDDRESEIERERLPDVEEVVALKREPHGDDDQGAHDEPRDEPTIHGAQAHGAHSDSTMTAMPWPPPMHAEPTAVFNLRLRSARSEEHTSELQSRQY